MRLFARDCVKYFAVERFNFCRRNGIICQCQF
jgi:hypothetical protein